VITALTGAVVAVRQLSSSGGESAAGGGAMPAAVTTTGGPTTAPRRSEPRGSEPRRAGGAAAGRYVVWFTAGTTARPTPTVRYDVLSASATADNPGTLKLAFRVRMTNDGDYDANFWSASFRLLAGGSSRAPTDFLDDLVHGHSSGDGAVTFEVPTAAKSLVLVVGGSGKTVRLPLALTRA
jgi:hypothetical protein